MTSDVLLYEVGPRDGLQNEPETVATAAKHELITRLGGAGLRRIEITANNGTPQTIVAGQSTPNTLTRRAR